jgi:hypothetical protein
VREQRLHPLDVAAREPPEPARQVCREQHADADGFAVQPFAIAERILDGVTESVAEVEERACSLLALVGRDDARLDLAGPPYGMREGLHVERQQPLRIALEPAEESCIVDQPVFHDLCQSRSQFAHRQGAQRRQVGEHRARLVKGADEILAAGMIHAGLAADGRIHLREQRRRYLHEIDATLITGSRETRNVADHAATEADHASITIEPLRHHRVEHLRQGRESLVLLAVW